MPAAGDFDPTRVIAGFQRICTAAADWMSVQISTHAPADLFKGMRKIPMNNRAAPASKMMQ
ncbi:MAG: hypothetical protein ABMA01_06280 [Chthoniobacteraceae bacterium]|jgi:hypothetical protein